MISDGYRVRNAELGPEGIPFVRGGDIRDGWIDTRTVDHIRPEFTNRVQAKLAHSGDVAFITKGTVGRAGQLRLGQPTVVFAPQVAYWRVLDTEVLDPGYVFYLIRSHQFRSALDCVKTHGAMAADYVSISMQHDFSFKFPDIRTQRSIARVLGSLDEKIELDRHMIRNLALSARALFKSWFVDFDPVRQKMGGRETTGLPPGMEPHFPDHLVESEIGPIPAGWRVCGLGQIARVVDCLHSRKPTRSQIGRPLLQLSNIREDGLLDMTDVYRIDEREYELWTSKFEAAYGDCVITNVGRVGAVAQVPVGIRAALGRNMTGIRHKAEFPYPVFLGQALLSDAMRREIRDKTDTGTILDALNVRNIPSLRMVIPTQPCLESAEAVLRPLRQMMESLQREVFALASARDALLPQLMTGRLGLE